MNNKNRNKNKKIKSNNFKLITNVRKVHLRFELI